MVVSRLTQCRLAVVARHKTKIVCTLGPASSSEAVLREMILAGMDMVRLNFSHGTHEEMRATFDTVRRISSEFAEQVRGALCLAGAQ